MIKGINHITFSVSSLEVSVAFYQQVFEAALLFRSDTAAYFDLAGVWLALNVEEDLPRYSSPQSYTHIAFTIGAEDVSLMKQRLNQLHIPLVPGRLRDAGEGLSLYFTDPDGHLLEVHAGDRETRINAYQNS